MPHRNRVDPFGEIVAIPQRGRWMGNRGILHVDTTIVRPWQHRHWIICETEYKDWRAPQWLPGRYTPLFFLDEAVALAAGHRPCALCRYQRWRAFLDAWRSATGDATAARDAVDRRLQRDRRDDNRAQRTHTRSWRDLPAGTFVVVDDTAMRVNADELRPWTPDGYRAPLRRPSRGDVEVLTPAVTVDVLAAGYRPS
jgi:hypothetical protein